MSRFIEEASRSQSVLPPETIEEYVAKENPVRVIDAFVEVLDLAKLGFKCVEPEATGRPGYHPATMLKIYLYGYVNRIQSSRRPRARGAPESPTDVAGRALGAGLQDARRLPRREHRGDQECLPRVHRNGRASVRAVTFRRK